MKRFGIRSYVLMGAVAAACAAAAVVLLAGRADEVFGDLPLVARMYTRWVPPTPPPSVPPASPLASAEREAIRALGRQIRGRLVWSSNRLGNHELFLVTLPGGEVRQLTDHPHVDFFSRFSPDGRQISFIRSRRPWVSFREEDAWDLYVMNADGTGERRLAEHAYSPVWTPDGSAIVFQRGNRLMRLDLASGRERLLLDGDRPPIEGRIGDPDIRADGALALRVRWQQQFVGVLDPSGKDFVRLSDPSACQITWTPDGERLLWIAGHRGRGGNLVMHGQPGGGAAEVLIDLPGEYSHEYFPRVTNDGGWLVWGAAAEGHEHDRADYEIFVWALGTPWDTARRVTFSPANDQWPDLWVN